MTGTQRYPTAHPGKTEKPTPFCAPCKWSRVLQMTLEAAAKIGQNQDSVGMLMQQEFHSTQGVNRCPCS